MDCARHRRRRTGAELSGALCDVQTKELCQRAAIPEEERRTGWTDRVRRRGSDAGRKARKVYQDLFPDVRQCGLLGTPWISDGGKAGSL